jgi:hypothetical protein
MAKEAPHHDELHSPSRRATRRPRRKEFYESPRWVPILMTVLLALGALAIMLRYIVPAREHQHPVLIGLGVHAGRVVHCHQVEIQRAVGRTRRWLWQMTTAV